MATYSFGDFFLSNSSGVGYFVPSKELPTPTLSPVVFSIARYDGVKKSGSIIGPRSITLPINIVGSSRLDLLSRLDALQRALSKQGQSLTIHDTLTRSYRGVDVLSATGVFTSVITCECAVTMQSYDPYAYATTVSTYDTGTVALTLSNGTYHFATISLTSVGTAYAWPLIRLTNKSNVAWTNVTITQNEDSRVLSVGNSGGLSLPSTTNSYIDFQCDPSASDGWTAQVNGSGNRMETIGLFPCIEPGTTTIDIAIAASSAISADASFSWQDRWQA